MRFRAILYPVLTLLALVVASFFHYVVGIDNVLVGLVAVLCGLIGWMIFQLHQAYSALNHNENELQARLDELEQSQAQLVQSEKMSSLGQMVAGVTHEINTPLAYTRSNTVLVEGQLSQISELVDACAVQADFLLLDQAVDEDQLAEQIGHVAMLAQTLRRDQTIDEMRELLINNISGLDQISELVSNLKNFSRLDRQKMASVDLNEGLESVLVIARNELKYKVELEKDYGDIPPVLCSPSQINQVFLNLIVNAAQAIEGMGIIQLRTYTDANDVIVEIKDNGKGIPADILPKIFDPFFTTKDVGEGTGLGLSIAYQIIQQHGGDMQVHSTTGQGTQFTIRLPILSKLAESSDQNLLTA